MSDQLATGYDYLLDATVRHLKDLKSRGTQYVSIDQHLLEKLKRPTPSLSTSVDLNRAQAKATKLHASPPTPQAATLAPQLPEDPKTKAISELRNSALTCTKCPNLVRTRRNVVFGVGDINAAIMFVGEAPGADEDQKGEPFVGQAGALLTKIITAMGLSRETVYIANILKCRPDIPEKVSGNRKPTADEMKTCIPYLHAQIDLIKPKVLIALGATAVEGLLGHVSGISKLRGQWNEYRGIPLMPTYHPAYLLRNQSNVEKRKVWEDMLKVMEKTELSISPKQKGYFLPPAAKS